jgi:hypothetical protein
MKFITDKEQVKAGLIIFRRGDVGHDRILLPHQDSERGSL